MIVVVTAALENCGREEGGGGGAVSLILLELGDCRLCVIAVVTGAVGQVVIVAVRAAACVAVVVHDRDDGR